MKLFLFTLLTATVSAMIRGISHFGCETEYMDFMCTWTHPVDWHVAKMKELNFTHIRVPFSYDYIQRGDWSALDTMFSSAEQHGLNITLDFHRIDKTHQSARPYNDEVSFDAFLSAWKKILERYHKRSPLEALDIFNEYQPSNYEEWNNLARQIISYLERHFPDRFKFYVGGTQWGGNLQFVDLSDMPCHDRIYYTIHKYHFSDKEPLEMAWNVSFGPHKVIVNVGEWGFMSDRPDQVAWANRFVDWLKSQNISDSYFWTWSFNSGDTGGILREDCTSIDEGKMNLLRRYWS